MLTREIRARSHPFVQGNKRPPTMSMSPAPQKPGCGLVPGANGGTISQNKTAPGEQKLCVVCDTLSWRKVLSRGVIVRESGVGMHLIIAIVHEQDAPLIVATLVEAGLKVTQISATGKLLQPGSAALLLGVSEDELRQALQLLHAYWQEQPAPPAPDRLEEESDWQTVPLPRVIGGGSLFILPVERYEQVLSGVSR